MYAAIYPAESLGAMPSRRRDHLCGTPVPEEFLCKHCDDLLKEAVQTKDEGVRLCKICYDTIARSVNSFIGMFYT